jgi:hypothetical protein
MPSYLDTSVVGAWLFGEPNRLPGPWDFRESISSDLIRVEVARLLRREFGEGRLTLAGMSGLLEIAEAWMGQMEILPISRSVLQRAAGPFPTAVRTLDAIHLASALLWQENTTGDVTFLTHDRQLRIAAQACGLMVSKP